MFVGCDGIAKNVQFVTIKLGSYVFGVKGVSFLETKNVQVVLFKEDWDLIYAWMQTINIDRRKKSSSDRHL